MSYQLIENLQMKAVTVSQACRTLEVSRSGYYAAAKRRSTVKWTPDLRQRFKLDTV